jgi:hypothetical protein
VRREGANVNAKLRRWKTRMFHVEQRRRRKDTRSQRWYCSTWNTASKAAENGLILTAFTYDLVLSPRPRAPYLARFREMWDSTNRLPSSASVNPSSEGKSSVIDIRLKTRWDRFCEGIEFNSPEALLLSAAPNSQDHLISVGKMNRIGPSKFGSQPSVRGGGSFGGEEYQISIRYA